MNKIKFHPRALFLLFSSVILILLNGGCAHEVYSLEIDKNKKTVIATELEKFCTGGECNVGECWAETASMQVCTVKFSFVSVPTQEKILAETSNSLSKQGMHVGFCGRDLNNTLVVGAFFRGVGTNVAAGVLGEAPNTETANSSAAMTDRQAEKTLNKSKNVMMNACESTPQKTQ